MTTPADQPPALADRIAAAMAGHSADISNDDGTGICNCGATVRANPVAWRQHRASTVLAAVQPELDARDAEIARLRSVAQSAAVLLRAAADRHPADDGTYRAAARALDDTATTTATTGT